MLGEIKEELLKNPEGIVEILEYFDFAHIKLSSREIRFARDGVGGRNISIRLERNECLYTNDYARGVSADFFQYIIQEKNVTFREVLQKTKQVLNLSDDWHPQEKKTLFGGIYNNILRPNKDIVLKTYDESVLDKYEKCGNLLWLNEGISLEAQRFYDVRFDVENNGIVFPWRNDKGEIICVKSRYNGDPPEGVSKYYYPISSGNVASGALFNYSECYEYLFGADVVYCAESEKTCMKGWSRGVKNILAIGSHSLTPTQCKLILQLRPKSICFILDSNLDLAETKKNADLLRKYASMFELKIKFWDWRDSLEVGEKSSPMDGTMDNWNYIVENEIKDISELDNEFIEAQLNKEHITVLK